MTHDPSSPIVVTPGKISRVTLHGRGALITRQIASPDALLPPDTDERYTITLRIPHLTARADLLHARVKLHADSPHQLLSIHGFREVNPSPSLSPLDKESLERRIKDITLRMQHLTRRETHIDRRRQAATQLHLSPARHRDWLDRGPLGRIQHALDLSSLLLEHVQELDRQKQAIARERLELDHTQSRLLAEHLQHRDVEPDATAMSTCFEIELRCVPHQPLLPFELSYIIHEARWWPLYTLRLGELGEEAELSLEAMIAQDSGEDWEDVALDLSTADLHLEATLPTLPALKIGKATPPRRTGFRPPPDGMERLFGAYEQFERRHQALFSPHPVPEPTAPAKPGLARAHADAPAPSAPPPPRGAPRDDGANLMTPGAPMPAMARGFGGGATLHKQRKEEPEATRKRDVLKAFDEITATANQDFDDMDDERLDTRSPASIDIASQWLLHASLQLGEGKERGRLVATPSRDRHTPGSLVSATEVADKRDLRDPRQTRGHYDYRYTSAARHTITSNGLLHRVELQKASSATRLSYRCVPLETQEVFRVASITNPFDGPMLGGPIDVFIAGSFLLTTAQHHVDRGADFKVGLGVEERIRVARNVRTEEEQLGLLGGKTSTLHVITTDLTSNLGHGSSIELLERIPIAGDDEIQVKEFDHEPPATVYHHDEASLPPLEGGRRWQIDLKPGQTRTITSRYAIILNSKLEVRGGNRRD